jgi:hypothetical protein
MRVFDQYSLKEEVARQMWKRAMNGTWDGRSVRTASQYQSIYEKPYFERCIAQHRPTGTIIIFTRDEGMHTSGWWKNKRCLHLSLSFRNPETGDPVSRDVKLSREWLEVFFHDNQRLIWAEPPYSDEGKGSDVWHYRVFCDPFWVPMLPRGEVYSREFTEVGWKSFSELGFELHPELP